jgi:CARDB
MNPQLSSSMPTIDGQEVRSTCRHWTPIGRGPALAVIVVLLLGGASAVSASGATTSPRPDLVISSISAPPNAIDSTFKVRYTIANAGRGSAAPSHTVLYLGASRNFSSQDGQIASQAVPRLAGGTHQSRTVTVNTTRIKPGTYFLIACADGTRQVPESSDTNNCRASQTPGKIAAPCPATNATCAQHAVFVSATSGDDFAAGTRAQPKRTLAAAVATASHYGDNVYATVGTYYETLIVANGVSVYGGYDSTWKPASSGATVVAGSINSSNDAVGVEAPAVTKPTTLEHLTITAPSPSVPGHSSYGVQGFDSGGLRLLHVTIHAAQGAAGANGLNGTKGADGAGGQSGDQPCSFDHTFTKCGGAGGASPVGHNGGAGATGILVGECNGTESDYYAQPGQAASPDAWGNMGGSAGNRGSCGSNYTKGQDGGWGDNGIYLGNGSGGGTANGNPGGFWLSQSGTKGPNGTDGHGGGGGGGGGSDEGSFGGGGGGGGGGAQGGGGGTGGQGGGGSFGIYLLNSAGAQVVDSTVTAADGGAGGHGGAGAWGGTGGSIGFGGPGKDDGAEGGAGGAGGNGGRGGDGGGGAGGPSYAIFGVGPSATPGTNVSHGNGGAGGAGGNGAGFGAPGGATGLSGDYM